MEDLNQERAQRNAEHNEPERSAVHEPATDWLPQPEQIPTQPQEESEAVSPPACEQTKPEAGNEAESIHAKAPRAAETPDDSARPHSASSDGYQWKISQLGAENQTPYGHRIDVGTPGFTMQRGSASAQTHTQEKKKGVHLHWIIIALLVIGILVGSLSITFSTRQQLRELEDYMESYGYNDDSWSSSNSETMETTIERAELGEEFSLALQRRSETDVPLTMQELYAQCAESVVYVFAGYSGSSYSGSEGSGVILTEDGYIVTNAHVIVGGSSASITLSDGSRYSAKLVGMDEKNDLAVLKVDVTGLSAAVFANSDDVEVGEAVAAIGNPMGFELRGTITEGIVSAVDRSVWVDNGYRSFIQTSAPISSGNSGGALFDMYGRVIGITTLKYVTDISYDSFAENLGFAIPSTRVRSIIEDLIAYGTVPQKATIGITVSVLSSSRAQELGLSYGLSIEHVEEDSAAAEAGLVEGDILLEAQQQPLYSSNDLLHLRDTLEDGEGLELTVYRDGERFTTVLIPK